MAFEWLPTIKHRNGTEKLPLPVVQTQRSCYVIQVPTWNPGSGSSWLLSFTMLVLSILQD